MKKLATVILTSAMALCAMAQSAPQLRDDNIDEVLAAMTLHEKAQLVVGTGMGSMNAGSSAGVLGAFAKIVPGAAGTTTSIPRLGIPSVVLSDGPAGLRISPKRPYDSHTYYCTHFPIGSSLASTWDAQLVSEVGAAIGNETREYGADVLLAPGVCIQRNPLCGRNFEYYSEDPVLSGNIAAAYISGIQSQGVGTSIKHYAFNQQETMRLGNDARVSQRAAREIYLKNFEIAIKKSNPWTVMSSYNLVNGTMTSERRDLLTTILRNEWGYRGLVMTDWLGGTDPVRRHGGTDRVANMLAGNDLIEPGAEVDTKTIEEAVQNGQLDVKYLDECVRNVLQLIVKTPRFKGYNYSNEPDLKAHAAVAREAGAQGTVLLENNGALPLDASVKSVALYGVGSYDPIAGGTGSGNVNRAYTVSLVEGMRNCGFTVDEPLTATYSDHIVKAKAEINKVNREWWKPVPLPAEIVPTDEQIAASAKANDVAIITIERLSGEGIDRVKEDFNLTADEKQLISKVTTAFHQAGKKVVVVLNVGGVIEMASWKSIPDAIILPWQCGQEIGNSVALNLTGKTAPSGHLPQTWPIDFNDVPSSQNFPTGGEDIDIAKDLSSYAEVKNVGYTNYDEDIYVGYRYFDTFKRDVAYPFGYGLSYTTFGFSDVQVSDAGQHVQVTVTVTNTGNRNGKQVAQVYVTAPKGSVEKPTQELKAFAKTRTLKPGEAETLTMTIEKSDLASFSEKQSAWVVDGGTYTFGVGDNSRNILATATLKLKGQKQKVSNVLRPTAKLNVLTQKKK